MGKLLVLNHLKVKLVKKQTEDITNLAVVPFKKINGSFHLIPDNIFSELSSDQKYM